MKPLLLSITLLLLLLLSSGTQAADLGGVQLPKTRGELHLRGAGLLRKGLIFKIYVGALYVTNKEDVGNILGDVPKRLDIHYFHHTPKKYMVRVAEKTLRNNLSEEKYQRLLPKIEKLHSACLNGKKSSFASIIHTPGQGLTYCFDNEPVITIDCDDFANAYFTIWLGEKPSSQSIKQSLLEPIYE